MSRLEDLIKKLCPNGVEFKTLEDVAEMQRGTPITQKDVPYGPFPVMAGGREPAYFCDRYNRNGETIVVAGSGANAGFISYWRGPVFVSDAFSIKGKEGCLTRYLLHVLLKMQLRIHAKKQGAGVPHVHIKDLASLQIPFPPLEVQQEIARILDKFATLEAELEAELEARKKQYLFYREKLLNFKSNTPPLSRILGEVCEISRGVVMSKKFIEENKGPYPVYSSQTENNGELGRISTYNIDGEYLTWTTDGANAGSVFYRTGKFSITNVCGLLKVIDKSVLSTRFLYYVLQITAKSYVNKGMGNPKLMSNVMATVKVPVPPLAEQKRIVEILDKFSTLIDDISSGLPAEIKMRHQQYEYYRDKLLTFTQAA